MSVGHRITARLAERGLLKVDLARHFKRNPTWVSRLCSGKKHLTADLAERLCAFLGVPPSFFSGDIFRKTTEPPPRNPHPRNPKQKQELG